MASTTPPIRPARRLLASLRSYRARSNISTLSTPNAISIALNPSTTSKDQLLTTIKSALPQLTTPSSAILLFSKTLTPQITDPSFLLSLFPSPRNLTVLAAAVDSIPYFQNNAFQPTQGISLLHSPSSLFKPESPTFAALDFHLSPLGTHSIKTTLPLANTVFQNGKQHTIFTTTWTDGRVSSQAEATRIAVRLDTGSKSRLEIPMIPITPPRRIVEGLGNILTLVERNGKGEPASKELEEVIPKLLQQRATPGGTSVWAVLRPEGGEERRVGERGVQVRKVLSGGGGWGKKMGLLSLDPDVEVGLGEEEDIELFARDFMGKGMTGSVQFVVEPWVAHEGREEKGVVVGTQAEGGEVVVEGIHIQKGVFGGCSGNGIYVSSKGEGVTTRVDMGGSYVVAGF